MSKSSIHRASLWNVLTPVVFFGVLITVVVASLAQWGDFSSNSIDQKALIAAAGDSPRANAYLAKVLESSEGLSREQAHSLMQVLSNLRVADSATIK